MARDIHPTAIVDPAAELADSVTVGPYAVIGAGVRIDGGTSVGSHVTIEGPTTIGRGNVIHAYAALGCAPQDMKYRGEPTSLQIGDRNTIFQFCTFSRGTTQDAGVTRVGSDNWIMAYVHLAHDVRLGDHTVLANNATLAGHVHVGDWTVIGGLTGVHQFVHIGAHAMVGFQAHVAQDVAPFMTVDGNPLAVRSVNLTGLKRRGFSAERIAAIRQVHKLIFRSGLTLERAMAEVQALKGEQGGVADGDLQTVLDFVAGASRGLVR
jgi:UDP-N-acetylglucosamine acyltransferase